MKPRRIEKRRRLRDLLRRNLGHPTSEDLILRKQMKMVMKTTRRNHGCRIW